MAGVKGRSGGHNKKSIEEHKRHGTYREDKHGGLVVKPNKLVRLDMPVILDSTQPISKDEIFAILSGYLFNNGQTAQEDEIMLTLLVDQIEIYRQAAEIFRVEGVSAAIGRQLAKTVMTDAAKEIRVLLAEFSLTPSTRSRMTTIDAEAVEVNAISAKFEQRLKKGND